MYEEEEEDNVNKIKIPKHKILYSDIDIPKKEVQRFTTNERQNSESNQPKKDEDAKPNNIEKILEYASVCLDGNDYDKDIASKLKKKLDDDPELNYPSVLNPEKKEIEEHGVWQVIVGRQFIASITFDAKYLLYFLFEETGKYFLIFRS